MDKWAFMVVFFPFIVIFTALLVVIRCRCIFALQDLNEHEEVTRSATFSITNLPPAPPPEEIPSRNETMLDDE
ncbi:unnamed protein product [Caenorhabditis auriculariae]|uniref:Uncharacterized protein n=1 Tax=Caenorhabditis auriculariae TaxID=2777116 RepID=A0A8S1HH86_9PELO|nr:unnamed protein product [Caenorhabditis auriculariae]